MANDYAIGFIWGLKEQYDEQKRNNQEWGLVISKDQEVKETYEKKEFSEELNVNVRFEGHSSAYTVGFADGKNFSISDRLAEGEVNDDFKIQE